MRVAIGASRARLVRQWLTESVLLGLLGSLVALFIVRAATPLLHAFVIPESVDLTLNPRVLGFTLIVGIGSGLLFGLAPAMHVLRRDTIASLRAEGGAIASGARAARMRGLFVILQVALSLVLLVGAGLFLRTLGNAYAIDLGYRIDRVLVARLDLQTRGYSAEEGTAAYEQILSRINAIPGVAAASAARVTVLNGGARTTSVSTDGLPIAADNSNSLRVRANIVSARYFETMNMPILRGRAFDATDGPRTPRVVVVTRSLADRLWRREDAIGKTMRDDGNQLQVVVGIVPDTVYTSTMESERPPAYYLLLAQNYFSGVSLHVRAAGGQSAASLVPAIRDAVRQVDSQLAVAEPRPLRDVLDTTLNKPRMMATLVGLFGAVALILAALGLYGVMTHLATQRTPEIGIRVAMGARPASILGMLLAPGLRLLVLGAAVGLFAAFAGTRYIESQLFGVTSTDPSTFVAGCAVLGLSGLAAAAIPALRAMRVDPVVALRQR